MVGGVLVVVFWWCFCGGVVVVFLRWYSGGIFVVVLETSSKVLLK